MLQKKIVEAVVTTFVCGFAMIAFDKITGVHVFTPEPAGESNREGSSYYKKRDHLEARRDEQELAGTSQRKVTKPTKQQKPAPVVAEGEVVAA